MALDAFIYQAMGFDERRGHSKYFPHMPCYFERVTSTEVRESLRDRQGFFVEGSSCIVIKHEFLGMVAIYDDNMGAHEYTWHIVWDR